MLLIFWGALRENVEKEDKKSLAELGVSRTPNYHEGKAVYINESRLYRLKMFEGVGTLSSAHTMSDIFD